MKFERELLEKVAEEMNTVMGLTPALEATMPDDDTLYETVVWEARGRGVENDAIRADDFVSADPDKKVFSKGVAKFFVDAGVWDAKNKCVIAAPMVEAEPELPLAVEEQAEHDEMEAGETTEETAPAAPVRKPVARKPAKKAQPAPATRVEKAAPMPAKPEKKKTSATAAPKKAAKKTKEAAKKHAVKETGPSNKLLVFQAWKHGKGETDVVKLVKHVKGSVTEGTVRGWLSAWGKGKNLPGGVKK